MKASKSSMKSDFKVDIVRQVQHVMPEMHYHDFYEVYIQDQGTREMIISNTLYCLQPHDVLLLRPSLLHQSVSGGAYTRTVVYFTEEYLHRYFSPEICTRFTYAFRYRRLVLSGDTYYKISGLIREMSREAEEGNSFAAFAGMMLLILGDIIQMEKKQGTGGEEDSDELAERIPPVLEYVHENYLTLSGLEEIAATFYITPSHLCRTFKKLTGYTIIQYINFLKIQKACELLHGTDSTVTDIAMECGYHSAMYFCKMFKLIMNMTPTVYRKQLKDQNNRMI